MEVDPNRVDYLAKLLDTYYASKNLVDFVTCAEALREMGEEANNEYWDKVEIMGYELAPYNELFAGGKNRGLPGSEPVIGEPASTDDDPAIAGAGFAPAAVAAEANADIHSAEARAEDRAFGPGAEQSADAAAPGQPMAGLLQEDDDPTDLNFADDATRNVNFEQDAPIILDQVEDDGAEQDEDEVFELDAILDDDLAEPDGVEAPDPAASLENDGADRNAAEVFELDAIFDDDPAQPDEAGAPDRVASLEDDGAERGEADQSDPLAGLNDDLVFDTDEIDLDEAEAGNEDAGPEHEIDANETMKFNIAGENEFERRALAADTDSLEDLRGMTVAREPGGRTHPGRVLAFPEHRPGREASAEFEAELKMSLQAIRDQLQYLTERLYRQERESGDIRQALAELHARDDADAGAAKKKSS
jgi:hypothetical protein